MRQIKFRAWVNGKMTESFTVEEAAHPLSDIGDLVVTEPSVELMQFTGLQDKNGKDIYEGDIVNQLYLRNYGELGDKSREIVQVKFQPTSGYNIWPNDVEVIGNIYESPELLEDK